MVRSSSSFELYWIKKESSKKNFKQRKNTYKLTHFVSSLSFLVTGVVLLLLLCNTTKNLSIFPFFSTSEKKDLLLLLLFLSEPKKKKLFKKKKNARHYHHHHRAYVSPQKCRRRRPRKGRIINASMGANTTATPRIYGKTRKFWASSLGVRKDFI